jgi:hypothetical protein
LFLKIFQKNTETKLKNFLKETISNIMKFTNEERMKINVEPLSQEQIKQISKNCDNLNCIHLVDIIKNFREYILKL